MNQLLGGLTIGEVAALFGLVGGIFSGIMFLFKSIVITPLNNAIESLQKSIDAFNTELSESKKDRAEIHIRINKIDKRVSILEKHDEWEENHK